MKKIISFDKSLDFKSMVGEITSISLDHTLKFVDGSNIEGEFLIAGSYKLTEASRLEENFDFRVPVEIALGEVLDLSSAKIEIEDFNYEIENDDTLICHIEIKVEGVEEVTIEEIDEETPTLQNDTPILESVTNENEEILERECDGDMGNKLTSDEPVDKNIKEIESSKEVDINNSEEELKEDEDNILEDPNRKLTKQETVENNKQEVEEEEVDNNEVSSNVGSLFSSFKDSDETFSTYSVYILRGDETIESIMSKYNVNKEQLENYNDLSNLESGSKVIIPTTNERDS